MRIELDTSKRQAFCETRQVRLAPREFDVLVMLAQAGGRVVTRREIAYHFWGISSDSLERTVDQHVSRLRKKFRDESVVRTVVGHGYASEAVDLSLDSKRYGVIREIYKNGTALVAVDTDALPSLKVGGCVRVI